MSVLYIQPIVISLQGCGSREALGVGWVRISENRPWCWACSWSIASSHAESHHACCTTTQQCKLQMQRYI